MVPDMQLRNPKRRVLVVDDNPDSAHALALLLHAMGHDVATAHDGRMAVQLCRGQRSELVLLDIFLPDMDGYEVARLLRQEHGSSLRIVAVTGFSGDDVRAQSREAGFDHHAVKPIDPAFLKSLLG
jgi:CheY-like chemotaxis protein